MYVPRSSPTKPLNYRPSAPRRHTTQVVRSDVNHAIGSVNMISSAGVRRPQAVKGGQRRSEEGRPMSPASSGRILDSWSQSDKYTSTLYIDTRIILLPIVWEMQPNLRSWSETMWRALTTQLISFEMVFLLWLFSFCAVSTVLANYFLGGSMPLIAAGVTHGPREGLNLPLHVDANVTRTQSLSTRHGGQRVIRTVTSVDEMVKLGRLRKCNRIPSIIT